MKKETLLLQHITQDLRTVVDFQLSNIGGWRLSYIVPFALLAGVVGVLLKNAWIGLLIFSVAVYHIVRLIMEVKRNRDKKRAVIEAIDRADISIAKERFECTVEEMIYEPHLAGRYTHATKSVRYYYFSSGIRWRIPDVRMHYPWSRSYYVSTQGLENVSIAGDEFYYVSLQGNFDIAYIYPCKFFELDREWGKEERTE